MLLLVGWFVVLCMFLVECYLFVLLFVVILGLIGLLIGLMFGGWFVKIVLWYWIFLINVLVGVVGCIVIFYLMFDLCNLVVGCFDLKGYLLLMIGMVVILLLFDGFVDFGM